MCIRDGTTPDAEPLRGATHATNTPVRPRWRPRVPDARMGAAADGYLGDQRYVWAAAPPRRWFPGNGGSTSLRRRFPGTAPRVLYYGHYGSSGCDIVSFLAARLSLAAVRRVRPYRDHRGS